MNFVAQTKVEQPACTKKITVIKGDMPPDSFHKKSTVGDQL